jgi:4'-phosphopantetheinyl transferase
MSAMRPPLYELAGGEVHLWFAFPDQWKDPASIISARKILDGGEIARMERFHFPVHRHLFMVSHLLVRQALSHYSDCPPDIWRFIQSDYGKPMIDPDVGPVRLKFSLAHTEGLAVVGVTNEGDIGVDVEKPSRSVDAAQLSSRFFSTEEAAALGKLTPDALLQERFFLYWTLKEAYIKALGLGLSHPLDSFAFHLTGDRPYRIALSAITPQDPDKWRFALLEPRPHWVTAVCVAAAPQNATVLHCYHASPSGATAPLDGGLLGLSEGCELISV